MHDFGKLTAYPEPVITQPEIRDEKGNLIVPQRTVNILTLKDKDGNIWHDLFRQHPHPFYIAITDDNIIISMESDPESSQITGHRIIGIDDDFGETRGPGGSVYGKTWDGSQIGALPPVLPDLSQRQIRRGLLEMGVLDKVDATIDNLSSPTREQTRISWDYSTSFHRQSPLLKSIMNELDLTDDQVDEMWLKMASL